MTWWKLRFDAKNPLGNYYGRACFAQADTEQAAEAALMVEAQRDYPDCEILKVGFGASTAAAAQAFLKAKQELADWKKRNRLTRCPACRQAIPDPSSSGDDPAAVTPTAAVLFLEGALRSADGNAEVIAVCDQALALRDVSELFGHIDAQAALVATLTKDLIARDEAAGVLLMAVTDIETPPPDFTPMTIIGEVAPRIIRDLSEEVDELTHENRRLLGKVIRAEASIRTSEQFLRKAECDALAAEARADRLEAGIQAAITTLTMPMESYDSFTGGQQRRWIALRDWIARRDRVKADLEALADLTAREKGE